MSPMPNSAEVLGSMRSRRRRRGPERAAARSEPPLLSQTQLHRRKRISKKQKRARATARNDEKIAVAAEHEVAAPASLPPEHEEVALAVEHGLAVPASPPPPEHEGATVAAGSSYEATEAASAPLQHEDEDEEEASSAVSSPLRFPYLPSSIPFTDIEEATMDAYVRLKDDFFAKQDRHFKLVTLEYAKSSCLSHPRLIHVRESATNTVLQTAKVVLGLSSYLDGQLLRECSGFLMDWDVESKLGIILTSALVIRSKSPSFDEWLAEDEYAPHAKVCVHLLDKDDTIVVADLLHYDKHYNIAMFKIVIDLSSQIPSFNSEVKYAQEVFVLGRDEHQNLIIEHGNVNYKGPSGFERHYYMFVICGLNRFAIGGPIIDFNGQFVGMVNDHNMSFIPSSVILKCLDMWKKFKCIPRLHVGMKFSAITLLDPIRIEKISRKCGVDTGLIVMQVGAGSVAEKLGVRHGDIIKSWNGKSICTTVELENLLLDMCKVHLDKGNCIGSNVDISVGIFRIRKHSHGNIKLTVNVSNDDEVIAEGSYLFTPTHDDVVHGEKANKETAVDEVGDVD